MTTLIYIHGQYGSPEEAEHYRPLFPGCEVIGLSGRDIAAAYFISLPSSIWSASRA